MPSQIARSLCANAARKTRWGMPFAFASSSESPTRAISGSVYVTHGVFAKSQDASATGESVFRRTMPAW